MRLGTLIGGTLLTALLGGAIVSCDSDNSRIGTVRVPVGIEQADTILVRKSLLNELEKRGIPREVALKYNRKILSDGEFEHIASGGVGGMVEAYNAGITPELAHAYNSDRFSLEEIMTLKCAHIHQDVVNEYLARNFDTGNILKLALNGVSPEVAGEYDSRFNHDDYSPGWGGSLTSIPDLVRAGVESDVANSYSCRFDGQEVCLLHKAGIGYEVANGYISFARNPSDIRRLVKAGVSSEQAEPYMALNKKYTSIARISVHDVINFVKEDIKPETIEERLKQLKIDKNITQ